MPLFLVANLFFVSIVAAISYLPPVRAVLELPAITFLGQVSYGIFVWHLIVGPLYLPTLGIVYGRIPDFMLYWTINLIYTMILPSRVGTSSRSP